MYLFRSVHLLRRPAGNNRRSAFENCYGKRFLGRGLCMAGQLRFPRLFSAGCVLQQGEETRIWGWCRPGTEVSLRLDRHRERTVSDDWGNFEVLLKGLIPGGPYVLYAETSDGEEQRIGGIYVGDVYVCAGQSNMELPMRRVRARFPEEYENGGAPQVHLYKVEGKYDFSGPLKDHVRAGWQICTTDSLDEASAFSYFFGKYIQEARRMPVGIINLSLGGTPVEAWMSETGLARHPGYLRLREQYQKDGRLCLAAGQQEEGEKAWQEKILRKEQEGEHDVWKKIVLPAYLEEESCWDQALRDFCGCIWLRRRFQASKEWEGRECLLRFGTMTDSDRIYINGVLVGETEYCYPPRRYPIPEGLLRTGENEIAVRLVCRNGKGRVTPGKPYDLIPGRYIRGGDMKEKPGERIDLSGEWEYQIRAVLEPAPEQVFLNRGPTGLFHGMVSPCLPYMVKGVVWYQGESNDCHPKVYRELLADMIEDWRRQWRQEELPFVIVQLPGCGVDIAGGEAWPVIREAQRQAGRLPLTAVTVNLDIGEENDLHPLDKKTAAFRASLAVRSMVYKETLVSKGPEPEAYRVENGQVILSFDTQDGEEITTWDGESPSEFEVAGCDGRYYRGYGKTEGKTVTVYAEEVERPYHIRYAWSSAPKKGLLCSKSGLTAGPFVWDLE